MSDEIASLQKHVDRELDLMRRELASASAGVHRITDSIALLQTAFTDMAGIKAAVEGLKSQTDRLAEETRNMPTVYADIVRLQESLKELGDKLVIMKESGIKHETESEAVRKEIHESADSVKQLMENDKHVVDENTKELVSTNLLLIELKTKLEAMEARQINVDKDLKKVVGLSNKMYGIFAVLSVAITILGWFVSR